MPYDLFISYAHKDNSREQVRELRDAILEDFHKFAGRELNSFFDEDEIRSMADWEDRRFSCNAIVAHPYLASQKRCSDMLLHLRGREDAR